MKISRKERNLLLYSEIIKEYKWLHKLLLKNETLKKEMFLKNSILILLMWHQLFSNSVVKNGKVMRM